jgi:hypothetical protein
MSDSSTLIKAPNENTRVVELPTVVGGGEEGHQLSLGEKLVAVLDHLMGATDQIDVVLLQERGGHVGPEDITDSSLVL